MKTYVLDTSVAMAWYLPERFSDAARKWQTRLLDQQVRLVVPPLHYLEFANVLRTYVVRKEIESSIALELYDTHLLAPLEVVETDRSRVLAVALQYQATVYDAAFVALALELGAILLTADRTTTPWVVKLGKKRVESLASA